MLIHVHVRKGTCKTITLDAYQLAIFSYLCSKSIDNSIAQG